MITIQYNLKEISTVDLRLKDITGKIISVNNFKKDIGIYESKVSLEKLNSGIYILEFVINNESEIIKFIKE